MAKKAVHTDQAPRAIGPYSQAVACQGFLFLSGQIALDPKTGELTGETAAEQARRVMLNLKAVLAAHQLDLESVVKTTIYLADLADFEAVNKVYGEFFSGPPPARSTIQAARLPRSARVEIDAIAAAG